MLEECGQVVAVASGAVLVQVQRQSACGSCAARAACGQGLSQMLRPGRLHEVWALSDLPLAVGDLVVLGVSGQTLLRSAMLVYLLPLLALLSGAATGRWLGLGEGLVIVSGVAGFAAALLFLRSRNRRNAGNERMQPVVLRVA